MTRHRPGIALLVAILAAAGATPAGAAMFSVDTTADSVLTACTAAADDCSLRGAIQNANGGDASDSIAFAIPGDGPHTITLASDLPAITQQVAIDGYTEPGSDDNDAANGSTDATLQIVLDANNNSGIAIAGAAANGSVIKGLVIQDAEAEGILIASSSENEIEGNFVGTDQAGEASAPNRSFGVHVYGGDDNEIGGSTPAERNLISGNGVDSNVPNLADNLFDGVRLDEPNSGSSGNLVRGNLIGTDGDGEERLPNLRDGISVALPDTTIGGPGADEGNVISGNGDFGGTGPRGVGIWIESGADDTAVEGNKIGTNATGTAGVTNLNIGVFVNPGVNASGQIGTAEVADVTIGGTADGTGNLISGNTYEGIGVNNNGPGTRILGNKVGTNLAGDAAIPNTGPFGGVDLIGSGAVEVGDDSGHGNLISGNASYGLSLSNSDGEYTVEGNRIGTNAAGDAAIPNGHHGLRVRAPGTIGGTSAGARNLVSGNTVAGIYLEEVTGTDVLGNYVGTNTAGDAAIANQQGGIVLAGSDDGTVADNLVSGNEQFGIGLLTPGEGTLAEGNELVENRVGTDAAGDAALANNGPGVFMNGALDNDIGRPGEGNLIAHNAGDGVYAEEPDAPDPNFPIRSDGNEIRGNSLHSNDGLGIDLAPHGVSANDAGDGDSGANQAQNLPEITFAAPTASTEIEGSLAGSPNTTFTIDLYENDSCDPSGHGEGLTHIGSTTTTSDPNGNALFAATLGPTVATGRPITATATDAAGNTSELSACRPSGSGSRRPIQVDQPPQDPFVPAPQQIDQPPGCTDRRPPITKLKRKGLDGTGGVRIAGTRGRPVIAARSGLSLEGTSRDHRSCPSGVRVVQVSLARVRGRTGVNCRFIRQPNRYRLTDPQNCRRPILFNAEGTRNWTFRFAVDLEPGLYRVQARGRDRAANKETPRKRRNIVFFEVR